MFLQCKDLNNQKQWKISLKKWTEQRLYPREKFFFKKCQEKANNQLIVV